MPTNYPRGKEFISGASRLAFGREDTFSEPAAPTRFLGITNSGLDFPDMEHDIGEYYSFGSGPQLFTTKFRRRTRNTTLSFLPTTAEMFYYPLGQDSKAAGDGIAGFDDPHTMEPVEDAHLPSLTLWGALKGSPNFTRSFPGTVPSSISCTLSEGQELQASLQINARTGGADFSHPDLFSQPTLDGTPSFGQKPSPYMFYDRAALVQVLGAYAGPGLPLTGGRSIFRVRNFNMSFSRALQPIYSFLDGTTPNGLTTPDDPRNPLVFTAGAATTTLSLDVTPAGDSGPTFNDGSGTSRGQASGGADAVYDILQQDIEGDVLVPFKRTRTLPNIGQVTDTLDFVFLGCKFRSAKHSLPEDRNQVTVPVNVSVSQIKVVAKDIWRNYGTM